MAFLFRAYDRAMVRQPMLTQCITCGLMSATGDIIAQKVVEKQSDINFVRTTKFGIFGMLYIGPTVSVWYRILDRSFGKTAIKLKPWQKMVADQAFFAPQLNFLALPILGLMNRKNIDQIKKDINDNYFDIMKASYKIWPAVQIVNFYLIPLNYRLVFVSSFALIWNTYFTWKLGEKAGHDNKEH